MAMNTDSMISQIQRKPTEYNIIRTKTGYG